MKEYDHKVLSLWINDFHWFINISLQGCLFRLVGTELKRMFLSDRTLIRL